MDYITIIITSIVSLIVLFFLTKLVGNKQISELSMFDYVVSISIGSIAAEMATELEKPERPLIAMIVYGVISFATSIAMSKSVKFRRIISGHSVVLMKDGKMFKKNLKKCHLDLSEFLIQSRSNGYFDISTIKLAVMEPSGKISFMPYPKSRPATPEDLKIIPQTEDIFYNVIMDGIILEHNLEDAKKNNEWLMLELKTQGIKDVKDVFLATLNQAGTLNVFKNYEKEEKNDYYL